MLKEHAAGMSASELCRKRGISYATFYKWRSRHGGMEISDVRKLEGPGRGESQRYFADRKSVAIPAKASMSACGF
jgi:hypothetical protein